MHKKARTYSGPFCVQNFYSCRVVCKDHRLLIPTKLLLHPRF